MVQWIEKKSNFCRKNTEKLIYYLKVKCWNQEIAEFSSMIHMSDFYVK